MDLIRFEAPDVKLRPLWDPLPRFHGPLNIVLGLLKSVGRVSTW